LYEVFVPRYRGAAFVLRKWDYGEADLLVSFFEQGRGKRRGIARGAKKSKKRFGGILSPLFLVQLEYFEKPGQSLVRIEGCTLIQYYSSFTSHLGKLLAGCCLLEILEKVLPEGPGGEEFFPLLHETLACLDREEETGNLLWTFLLRAFSLLGVQPQLGVCIHCKRPLAPVGVFGFSVPLGGPVCGGCVRRGTATHRVDAETLRLMRSWLGEYGADRAPAGLLERHVSEAECIIERFFLHHVSREFRSLRVMKDVLKTAGLNRKEGSRDCTRSD
jgi:DNA repair protein RecO (recombination protein O)